MAEVEYFLRIDGIEGESQAKVKEIDVLSWSWGAAQSGTMAYGGGGGAGKASIQDFSFSMKENKASPRLLQACITGEHIASATLVARKAGGEPQTFLTVTLTDVLVSSFQTGGSWGDPIPVNQVSVNFSGITYEYLVQDGKGTTKAAGTATYDVKKNTAEAFKKGA
jgi:type VI secretion system secreted protein Hcp